VDPLETGEWLDSLESVIERDGVARASYLLTQSAASGRRAGNFPADTAITPYLNTIPLSRQAAMPGDSAMEWRIRSLIRWNAVAMVVRANRKPGDLGGHIASFASSATLYDVGFNHFWRAASADHPGDLIFHQGHSSPGVYARSFLEGRLTAENLDAFRMEVESKGAALSSYPHPWLMPDYWQVPTVSMGLGPMQAVYQAQFWRYLENRGLMPASDRKVWCFLGDGECDEPESLGAIALAAREQLDNLIFVVNCNLQRLDGPVRGNGKVIQELEGIFRGSGWNAIKVVWGSQWDALLARDQTGELLQLMESTLDGEYQAFKALGGAYTREHFFGKTEATRRLVESMTDDEIAKLNRGGHDPGKVYAAYHQAVRTKGMPTVILAKTVKGYGMGPAGESLNPTHQQKKLDVASLKLFRDRFRIPLTDDELESVPYCHPGKDSPEVAYLLAKRKALGGFLPQRRRRADAQLQAPALNAFEQITKGSGDRELSTTMALVRGINLLLRDRTLGERVVPIVADEARTFGMEGMFRKIGIYAPFGQKYRAHDADQLLNYREDQTGQVLQQGISEGGAMASWIAAGTSYSISNMAMLPFFIYYAMFGFQRIGDLCWAAGDLRARGFLIGGTSGRTTLNGEGLQHEDGHSHLFAGAIPNVVSYDPTFSYEVGVILQDGVRRMMQEQEDVYYYLTVMNENYLHPEMPDGAEDGIRRGLYLFRKGSGSGTSAPRVQLLGSGAILREVIAASELLLADFGIVSDVWSATSFTELRRDGFECERWNRLHPEEPQRDPFVTATLTPHEGPVIAASDYVRGFAEQIRAFIPDGRSYSVLGTDGFGRSDSRRNLRDFFEVDRRWVAHAALSALARSGAIPASTVTKAMALYELDPDKANPRIN
jgi:pyruvate dehydrogenase E1 component